MARIWDLEGMFAFILIAICSCKYASRIPTVMKWITAEKHGVRGTFYKAYVVGTRLSFVVTVACILSAFFLTLSIKL